MLSEDQINLIEDNDFLDKDVSELIYDDIYLFHMDEDSGKIYFYFKGRVVSTIISGDTPEDVTIHSDIVYKKGTLREFIDRSLA